MFFVWKEFIQNMLWVVLNFDEKSLVCSVTRGLKVFTICRVITKLFRFVKECVNSSMFLIISHTTPQGGSICDSRYNFCLENSL